MVWSLAAARLQRRLAPAWTGGTAPSGIYRMQMSRNTGSATQIVDITVSWNAVDCVFAAHAVQHPAL